MRTASEIIERLGLQPHPEGGYFLETYRDKRQVEGRAVSTAIYYLLSEGERSHWHRVDAAEVWHFYAGAPLTLVMAGSNGADTIRLGPDILAGERPQAVVPPNVWQSAQSLGAWTLVGCTVSPGFDFSGFELAPEDWSPLA